MRLKCRCLNDESVEGTERDASVALTVFVLQLTRDCPGGASCTAASDGRRGSMG
jgi:hypothetical protein